MGALVPRRLRRHKCAMADSAFSSGNAPREDTLDVSAAQSGIGALLAAFRRAGASAVNLVLPPRCAGCGSIVGSTAGFCPDCWSTLDFLSGPACSRCDLPMETLMAEEALCGACLADPPPYSRVHVPLAYGAATRSIVMRLKYGRKTGFARLMARLMLRRLQDDARGDPTAEPPLFIPVPLHRWRIWSRGFNQSAEVAGHLARATGWPLLVDGLHRHKRTPPLRGLGRRDRAKTVRGAFTVRDSARSQLSGRRILLVDDVFTTGATAAACSRALLRAGASSVEVVAFARVIDRPDPADNLLPMIDSRVLPPNIAL